MKWFKRTPVEVVEEVTKEKPKRKDVLGIVKEYQIDEFERRVLIERKQLLNKLFTILGVSIAEDELSYKDNLVCYDTEGIRFYIFPVGSSGDRCLHARIIVEPNMAVIVFSIRDLLSLLKWAEKDLGVSFNLYNEEEFDVSLLSGECRDE